MNMTRGIRVSFGNGNVKTAVDRGTDLTSLALSLSRSIGAAAVARHKSDIYTETVGRRVGRGHPTVLEGKAAKAKLEKEDGDDDGRSQGRSLAHSKGRNGGRAGSQGSLSHPSLV